MKVEQTAAVPAGTKVNVSALVDDYAPENEGYSVVADPEGAEVNQYGLRYDGVPGLAATLGRSKLILDNARWVGNVGWRQNEQTFDAVRGQAVRMNEKLVLSSGDVALVGDNNTVLVSKDRGATFTVRLPLAH